jgi:hypothetical protein
MDNIIYYVKTKISYNILLWYLMISIGLRIQLFDGCDLAIATMDTSMQKNNCCRGEVPYLQIQVWEYFQGSYIYSTSSMSSSTIYYM